MGSFASKLLARYGDEATEPTAKRSCSGTIQPSTPENAKKTFPIDPRSASVGIPRTPIEINFTPPNAGRRQVSAIPPYLQKKQYLETDLDNIGILAPRKGSPSMASIVGVLSSPILNELPNIQKLEIPSIDVTEEGSPDFGEQEAGDTPTAQLRYKILGLDPRSPATDFDRTPILSPKSMKRLKARSLENLVRRDSYFELGISRPARLSYCETTSQGSIPEVLVLPEIVSNLDKAVNLDPVTENSDKFDSCSSSSSSSVETISESHEEITVIRNPNAKSAEDASASNIASSFGSSIEKIEDSQESPRLVETCIDEQFHGPLDNVNRVLSIATKARDKEQLVSEMEKRITVWRDSISSETSDSINLNLSRDSASAQSDADVMPKEEILIEFDDVEIMKSLKIKPTSKYNNLKEGVKKEESVEKKIKNTEMDGKIFFQDKIFTPDRKNGNLAPKVRTPLGNRSNNHTKGNGMPMKSPQQLLRGKAMSTHLCQENTPPRSIKSKHNGTQWDPDSTFLI